MSVAQRFAQIFGAVYLLVGILGFLPFLVVNNPVITAVAIGGPFTGLLLNIFAVNWFHSLAHLLIGAAGLATYRNPDGARLYALVIGVAYTILFIFGFIFGLNFLGGLLPLNGWDHGLHIASAVVCFLAFFASPRGETRTA